MTPGAVVRHFHFGTTAWVVRRLRSDGLVDIVSKVKNSMGGIGWRTIPATPGDITLVTAAPTYSPGAVLTRNGVVHTVLQDHGDQVYFHVGESFKELKGGGRLKFPSGNSTTIPKFDLVLENLT